MVCKISLSVYSYYVDMYYLQPNLTRGITMNMKEAVKGVIHETITFT